MKYSRGLLLTAATALCTGILATGCSTDLSPEPFDANLRLTAGQVKMTVKPGKTTQAEVFQALGAPNVVALQSGSGEIWTYDQIKVRRTTPGYSAGASFGTLFGFDNFRHGVGDAGAEIGGNVGTNTTSVQTATLIVRFAPDEKVTSWQMLVTSF